MTLSGRTIALVESGAVAVLLPAADTLMQALQHDGLGHADWNQVAAAGILGGLAYLIAYLRGLTLAPNGQPLPTPTPTATIAAPGSGPIAPKPVTPESPKPPA